MKLYQSFIVPHFNYCAESWNFCSKGATTKLEKLNERALRFVYRDYSSSYEMLLKQSGYQTLLNQRLATILTTVYKVVHDSSGEVVLNLPESFPEAFGYQAAANNLEKAQSVCSSGTKKYCKIGVASTSAASDSEVPSTYSAYCDVIDIDPEDNDLEMQQAIFQSTRRISTDQDKRYVLCSNLSSIT